MKQQLLSILTALALCLSLLPAPAFAAEPDGRSERGDIASTEDRPCTPGHTAECYPLGVLPGGNDTYKVARDTGARQTRTTSLVLTNSAQENTAEGWSWSQDPADEYSYILALDNVDFEVTDGPAIDFQLERQPYLEKISVVLTGENHIASQNGSGFYSDPSKYKTLSKLIISGGSLDVAGSQHGIDITDCGLIIKDTTASVKSRHPDELGICLGGYSSISIENSTVCTDRIEARTLTSQNSELSAVVEAYSGYGSTIIETNYLDFSGGRLTVSGPEGSQTAEAVYCSPNGEAIRFSDCQIDIRNVERGVWAYAGDISLENVTGTVFTTKSEPGNSTYQNAAFFCNNLSVENCSIYAQTGEDVVHTFVYGDYTLTEDAVWPLTGLHIQEGCTFTVGEGKKLTFTKDVTIHGNYENAYASLVNNGTLEFSKSVSKILARLTNNGTLVVAGFLDCEPENFTNNGTFNGILDDSRWLVFGDVRINYNKTLGKWSPTSYWADTIRVTDGAVLTVPSGKTLDASQSDKGITWETLEDYLSVAETGRLVVEEGGQLLLPANLPQEKLDALRLSGLGTVRAGDVDACRVIFKDGGANIAVKFVMPGGKAALSDNPEKDGYTLVWCTDAEGSTPFDFDTAITEDLTLYTKWIRNAVPVTPGDTVRYIVEHYREDAEAGYTLADTESPAGTIGTTVTAVPKSYAGFIYNAEKSTASGTLVKISGADDIVTLRLYYDKAPAVTGIALAPASLVLTEGQTGQLTADVRPADAGNKSVTWTSSNPSVAAVDAGGKVTAVTAGTAAITVTTQEGNYTASCTVTVNAKQYAITYDANGGNGAMTDGTATGGAAFVLPACGFTPPTGKVFDAWAVGGVSGEQIKAGESRTFTGNTTLYAIWKDAPLATYTVTYSANGGGGTMAGGTATSGVPFALPGCSFTSPEGKEFDCWAIGSVSGPHRKPGDSCTFTGDTTVYAVWKDLPYNNHFTGVVQQNGRGISGATVQLKQGLTVIAQQSTGADGSFTFAGVASGIYNLVAEKDGITVTVMQPITTSSVNLTITLPEGKTNSVVEIKDNQTPPVIVGELETIFNDSTVYTADDQKVVAAGGAVEFRLKVAKQETPQAVAKIEAIKPANQMLGLVLDLTIIKTVTAANGTSGEPQFIKEVSSLIETMVPLPADLQGKASYTVYREHNGKAEALPNGGSGERYEVSPDKTTITIYARKYSTYAIAWSDSTTAPVDPGKPDNPHPPTGGSSGGFIVSSTYAVTVAAAEHGKVSASRANAASGNTVTLTVTPDSGYAMDALTATDSQGNALKLTAKGDGKYTFTMPNRAVTVKATFAPLPDDVPDETEEPGETDCPSLGFTDLEAGAWYHEAVDFALRNGLMGGYKNGTFGPNDNLSRAQLAQILYNQAGRPAVTGASPFTDAADGAWYTDAITWAAAQGVVGGYGSGLFGPNDPITREQLAVMLWRHAGSPAATEKELHFSDADQAHSYSIDALRWAVESGILTGYGDGRLNPAGLVTRVQAAQMLKNFLESK